MLAYNEITIRKSIILEGEPYEVLSAHVFRKQQRKPVNQTKLRNLISGKTVAHTFAQSDVVEEVELESKRYKYLYNHRGEFWFSEENNPSKRVQFPTDMMEDRQKFLKPDTLVDAVYFKEKLINIRLPVKVDLKVTEAPPGLRGDTAGGGGKVVTLETGATVTAPLFIKEGDMVRINTDTGEYVERAEQ
jgi:elongation factor P